MAWKETEELKGAQSRAEEPDASLAAGNHDGLAEKGLRMGLRAPTAPSPASLPRWEHPPPQHMGSRGTAAPGSKVLVWERARNSGHGRATSTRGRPELARGELVSSQANLGLCKRIEASEGGSSWDWSRRLTAPLLRSSQQPRVLCSIPWQTETPQWEA